MRRPITIATVGLVWVSLSALSVGQALGLRVNRTLSMPQGVWLEHRYSGALRAGDAVAVCLPPTEQTKRYIGPGSCANGLEPLLKTVGAITGDVVTLQPSGALVNGAALPNTATLARDEAGRPLTAYPAGTYQVPQGQIFLFSSHDPRVYDSRYFGPVKTTEVIATATPVLTFK
jgi:conjugative transfer signal peptidase TraF